ncbi:conserved hypothetical protein [Trichormus variabilis ATCC 29413]|uniref:Uncharacterized protein n=2 Tax=Anabaena variabilis TaxID=264691 RepID=Q3MAI2_TRIV2|nr:MULTISPECIES: CTB family bacteriocin [Nostocaceae]ABA22004.1 conserved hypothetical protein [Trichormus variabilis ATCC 29413]MBC1215687.1 hypothetical protein [Trichormus variabilis ARAD]MBC1256137.1 hypothetical protein [Trichormus variabilis V5]MBC1268471.1 hypothetical protein [Trichormus variabilis FSR]MBC1304580.1 hypothetical protein [Trichormus variabilis N2B]
MSCQLFINLSDTQQAVVTGGTDFQIDATFYETYRNVLNGGTTSGPNGSTAFSNGNSTRIKTAGLALLALDADKIWSWPEE